MIQLFILLNISVTSNYNLPKNMADHEPCCFPIVKLKDLVSEHRFPNKNIHVTF